MNPGEELRGLAAIDCSIIGLYVAATLGRLVVAGGERRPRNTSSARADEPFLVGVSLFATLLSTISYMSMPGEALGKGPVNMLSMFALPVVFAIVGFVLLPVYMKQRR